MRKVSTAKAKQYGDKIGVNWKKVDLEQFRMGCEVEQEHVKTVGKKPLKFAEIARDHLVEDGYKRGKTYYSKLLKVDPHTGIRKKTVKRTVRKKK